MDNKLDLNKLREEIDKIDHELVQLYEKRMQVCAGVAEYKIATGKKVLDREREQQKISAVTSLVQNEARKQEVQELFEQIMSMSRKMQYKLIRDAGRGTATEFRKVENKQDGLVVYQGAEGSYSQAAMYAYFGDQTKNYHVDTFKEALEKITRGEADYAVLPIENSTAGSVIEVYDLLKDYDVAIFGEQIIKIEHCLMGTEDATIDKIKTVFSHPQSLMQSEHFLNEYSEWCRIGMKNNAFAAKKVMEDKDPTEAAIASEYAAGVYGLKILKRGVNNSKTNETRFLIITKDKKYKRDASKISICFEINHESGSLYRMLSHFIYNGLNMTKIESRPIEDRNWEYRFFVDFDGNLDDGAVQNALIGLSEETNTMKILGNY